MTSLEVWIDVVCPWCYIGLKHVQAELGGRADRDARLAWRAYELRPGQPALPGFTLREMMGSRFGLDKDELDALFERIRRAGAEVGLDIRADTARPVNTFDAHRLIRHAGRDGLATPMVEALFQAYLTDNRNIADPGVLAALAHEVGVEPLAGPAYTAEVRADRLRADHLGIRQVPAYVVDGVPRAMPFGG